MEDNYGLQFIFIFSEEGVTKMSGDFVPELNRIRVDSPTEDGKLAYVMNTMVPRRLEQFDDIDHDLYKTNFDSSRAYFYVNFQAGEFYGRSYKLPLSKLNEFVAKSLLFGTGGEKPVIKFEEENFLVGHNNEIHLLVTANSEGDLPDNRRLKDVLDELYDFCQSLAVDIDAEADNRRVADDALERKKEDKFYILGSGDRLNSEGLPEPKPVTDVDPYGVHVTVTKDTGPIIDDQGSKGPTILIDHDFKLPWDITCAYNIGGLAKDQFLEKRTPVEEII